MKSKRRIYIEAISFATFCLILAVGIPLLPNWMLVLIWMLWIPCGLVALAIFTLFLKERYGFYKYKGHDKLGAFGIVLGGMMSLIIVPILIKLWYPKT